jgi:calcium/proton exchanger cax
MGTAHGLILTAGALYAMIDAHGQGLTRINPHDRQKLRDFLSRSVSVILLTLYCLFQLFHRRSHAHLFEVDLDQDHYLRLRTIRKAGSGVATALLLCTIWVTYVCALPILQTLTTEKAPLTGDAPLAIPSQKFFSFCLLPLLAELAEISRTCSLAWNDEMELSFRVATTTCIHMMLLVAPLFCLSAWCMGISLDLDLGGVEVVMLVLNIYLSWITTGTGKSNYLAGFCIYGM